MSKQKHFQLFGIFPLLALTAAIILKTLGIANPFQANDWLALIIISPLIEEITFRLILFFILKKLKLNDRTVIVTITALFGLYHLLGLSLGSKYRLFTYLQVLNAMAIGWVFTWIRLRGGSIFICIALHTWYNLAYLASALLLKI